MVGRDLVCIGASAGGVELLLELVRQLPADYPGSLFVVLHVPPDIPSLLPRLLDRRSSLRAVHASDGEPIERGVIYVAPNNHHLLLKRDSVRVVRGPKENGSRPAIDPLFRTAAIAHRARVVGVVLSGNLDDGTVGLAVVKRHGGVTVAQDPEEAFYPSMPRSAIDRVGVDHIVRLAALPGLLMRLAHEPIAETEVQPMPDDEAEIELEADIAELDPAAITQAVRPGAPSGYGCPDCGGALFTLSDGDLVHFRCRVGHAWSTDGLMSRQEETLDDALWTALRALEENMSLSLAVAERLQARGNVRSAQRFVAQADVARRNAETIRRVLAQEPGAGTARRQATLLRVESGVGGNGPEP